jgi:predicted Zn-dependent protease
MGAETDADYFDGRSAQRRAAHVAERADGLAIGIGERLIAWPYAEIRLVGRPDRDGRAQLRRVGDDSRLVVGDGAFLAALDDLCPALRSGDGAAADRRRWAICGGVAAAVAALAYGAVELFPAIGARALPAAWEDALGERAIGELGYFLGGVCREERGQAALDAVVARIANSVETPYRFRAVVVRSRVVNAFALPGGNIVILRGLIERADSPDEVAGVLAHEIGHVVRRHVTEGILRRIGISLLIDSVTGGGFAASLAGAAASASYGRAAEEEADEFALAALAAARISPEGFAAFFERMGARDKGRGPVPLLASHPATEERAARVRSHAPKPRGTRPALDDEDWQALRSICRVE